MKPLKEAAGEVRARRIFFPGVFAAVGLHPYIASWIRVPSEEYFQVPNTVLLLAETFVLGLVVSSAANFCLFVLEGITLPWLTKWRKPHHERRVRRLQRVLSSPAKNEDAGIATLKLSDYPQELSGERPGWFAERPTLLGNIISTYELYPSTWYGVDGVTFWNHLQYLAPASARDDFSESLDFAESLVLTSFAGVLVVAAGGLTLVGRGLAELAPYLELARSPVSDAVAWFTLAFGLAVSLLFYRFSLPAYREVAKAFRAMVDLAMPCFREWIEKAPKGPPEASFVESAKAVRQYIEFLTPG